MNEYFDNIHGQGKATKILTNFYESGKIPHALLFTGNEGVGKFFTSVQFAKLINSGNNARLEQINKHISNLTEPYIKYIIPLPRGKGEDGDSGSTEKLTDDQINEIRSEISKKISNPYHRINLDRAFNIKISSIREIRKFLSLNFGEVEYRVVIIEEASQMNAEAQNALLKSLEEPPEGVIFILITSEPEGLLPTIKSRCWQIKFEPLSNSDVKSILATYFDITKERASHVALFSHGSVSAGLSLLENDFEKLLEKTIIILRYALAKKYFTALDEMNSIINESSLTSTKVFLQMILMWLSDAQKHKAGLEISYFKNYSDTIIKFNNKFSDADIVSVYSNIDNLIRLTDRKVNLNIISMNIIFEIASIALR